MDEETLEDLSPWRRVPMWMSNRNPSREELDRLNEAWHSRRDYRKRATPAASTDHGYPKPYRRDIRRIGFHKGGLA